MMGYFVVHQCFWAMVLNAHVCCKTCILNWDFDSSAIEAHTSTEVCDSVSYPSIEKDLISCQGVQRLVSENQLIPESLNSFLDFIQAFRKKTLPQMYFEDCSVFRGTYGHVYPLFQHPEDAALLMWKPGDYDHAYFMFVSQLYPHHEHFHVQSEHDRLFR